IFPSGEAINFTSVPMPCRVTTPGMEDPPGCGPRRNALAVIGYPTNWQLAHIDGDVNPDTDQTVRLFFTSPGPINISPTLPAPRGRFELHNSVALNPTSARPIEQMMKPADSPDCDANNNYRMLIGKGNLGGAYSIVLEDNLSFQARVKVVGGTIYDSRS